MTVLRHKKTCWCREHWASGGVPNQISSGSRSTSRIIHTLGEVRFPLSSIFDPLGFLTPVVLPAQKESCRTCLDCHVGRSIAGMKIFQTVLSGSGKGGFQVCLSLRNLESTDVSSQSILVHQSMHSLITSLMQVKMPMEQQATSCCNLKPVKLNAFWLWLRQGLRQ